MLPLHLQSSYKLYKEDTNDVATWLAETAYSLGYVFRAVPDQSNTKGQLRNAAKRPPPEQNQHVVPIREFSNLATHIALHASKSVKIPLSILHKLQRTIDARKKCNLWFQVNEGNEESNKSHSHFLNVLQQVSDILQPDNTPSGDPKVENSFSSLHIEEPSDQFTQTQSTSRPSKRPDKSRKYETEVPQDESEILFAAFTLFNDIEGIRLFVTDMWKEYHQGALDLPTVSVVSNTAIDLVERIENQFFKQFTFVKEPAMVIEMMYTVKAKSMGKEPVPFTDFDDDLQQIVSFTYGDILVLLKSFVEVMSRDSIPISKPGFFGVYKPRANRDKMSARERFDEDKLILGELLPDFWMLAWNKERTSWEDGLTKGFRTMLNSRKVSISTMFAAKLFLHVHHLLRSNVSMPFKQLQDLGKHMKESWVLALKMRDPSQAKLWPPENDRMTYSQLFNMIHHWLEEDSIGLRIKKLARGSVPLPEGDFRLFRQHPLMCGLLAFYLHCVAHRVGVNYTNAMGVTLYTSHLYNAVQQEGGYSVSWSDMELMIRMQSEELVFVGGKPKIPEDYFKRFCLCMGYSAEQFAAKRRQKTPITASRGPRALETKGGLSMILYEHYCKHTTTYLEQLEDQINSEFVVDDENESAYTEEKGMVIVAIKKRAKNETRVYSRQKFDTQATLSSIGSLLAMKSIIAQEIPMLAFDYLHLHRSCQMVLEATQTTMHDRFLKYFDAGYLETKSQLPFIIGYIFIVASNSYQLADKLGFQKPRAGVKVSSELLSVAGEMVEMLLADQNFGPHCKEATRQAAIDGRLMFSSVEEGVKVKSGLKVDFGAFELIYQD